MAISYMNGQQIIDFAAATTQQVSGMSVAEATAALGGKVYNNNGLTTIYTFPGAVSKGGIPVTLEAKYASQMWDYFKITGAAAISSIGTAAAGASAWAQGVLFGDPALSGTLAGSGGLLTMPLPAAASVFAPLLGVSLGATMYELAPEFWTGVSQALLPWAYDDKNTIAFVVDESGQVFAPKGAVDSLKEYFDSQSIGAETGYTIRDTSVLQYPNAYTLPLVSFSSGKFIERQGTRLLYSEYESTSPAIIAKLPDSTIVIFFSSTYNGIVGRRKNYYEGQTPSWREMHATSSVRTHGGMRLYYDLWIHYNSNLVSGPTGNPIASQYSVSDIATIIFEGLPVQEYPEGTSKWTGNSVDVSQLTPIQVVTGMDGATTPYMPVTLPIGDPYVSNDPLIQPDPTAPVQPGQLDPYISPVTIPEQWPEFPEEIPSPTPSEQTAPQVETDPLYVPEPSLNPEVNPALEPDVEPAKELPTNQQPATPSGQSPDPTFPFPDIPFPSWTPPGSDTPVASGQPGFVQIYHPTTSEFVSFGRWLWVTYGDSTIEKIWNNPFDGVIGAHELYAAPEDGGYSTIRCGFLDSGVSSQVVNQRYTQINCGSMVIPEYWGNYLDYSPYSQAMIYLPFIGIVNLDVDDIVGSAVNVLYHVDSYTGSCIAQITVARENYSNTLYQFSGNCSVEIPMAGGSQAQIKAALMTANAYQNAANVSANAALAGGIGSGLTSLAGGGLMQTAGNPIGLGMGAASGIQSLIGGFSSYASQKAFGTASHTANMLSGKAIVQHSGSFGSSHGAMGIKKPYIIIRRPIQKVVNGYEKLYGYPAHKQVIIGSCKGFLRCREVHVLSSLATDAEKIQIERLLTTGVYVTESVD